MSLRPKRDASAPSSRLNLVLRVGAAHCLPCAPTGKRYDNLKNAQDANTRQPGDWDTCVICYSDLGGPPEDNPERARDVTVLEKTCKHVFHIECLREWVGTRPSCPTCSIPIDATELAEIQVFPQVFDPLVEELCAASRSGDVDTVVRLLAVPGIDLNARNGAGETALCASIGANRLAVMDLLLAAPGIDVNARTRLGWAPLEVAGDTGGRDAMERLLAAPGIDVHAKNERGWTALFFASRDGRPDVVALLLAAGIDVNAKSNYDKTALMIASRDGKAAAVEVLLAAPGIDVNARDSKGGTALMWAAAVRDNTAVVERLLAAPGIDVNAKNNAGYPALIEASHQG